MDYRKMLAVTGMPGLFELIASKGDGAIVKSLNDGQTKFVSSRAHQFSHLETIEIYTAADNVNLLDIFKAMDAAGADLPDAKDAKALKAYFEKVYPDMDFDRVYSSDMKKMVNWFRQIKDAGVTWPEDIAEEETDDTADEASNG